MRSSECVTRAVAAAATAADSHYHPPFKNTSWHTHTHMHMCTHSKPSRHSPFIRLNPSIGAYILETKTLDKHGSRGRTQKAQRHTNMHMLTYTHTHMRARRIHDPDWLSAAEAGRGELRSHGVCCCNPLLHPRTGWPPPAAAAAVAPDMKRKR